MQSTSNAQQEPTRAVTNVSQVAWQFVVQYYTYMNSKPDQLHRFYTKNSHYLYGTEAEETSLLQGQTAIHKKILDIDFKGCKVFIHSVDAQPSANNGIIVHVIGEMSNNAEPWKKFVQAFFLAEQQNGYFVLNDNLRFLKEETFTHEDEEEPTESGAIPALVPQEPYIQTNGYDHASDVAHAQQPISAPIAAPAPAPPVSAPAPITPQESPLPPVTTEPVAEIPRPPTPSPELLPSNVPELIETVAEPVPTPPAEPIRPKSTSPVPPSLPPSSDPVQPAASPVPYVPPSTLAPAPAVPKTWASLAAANPSRWGQNVAQEVKGVSAAAPQPSINPSHAQPARERPSGGASTNTVGDAAQQQANQGKLPQQHPSYAAALAITSPLCFVKGVTDNIPRQVFEQVLTSRFGPIKECEIIRSKACAFLEFRSIESARRAIIASLSTEAGGEGGIRFDEEKYGSPARVNVETRKERGDRPAPRARGGATSGSGEGRGSTSGAQQGSTPPPGGFRGRGGARGRGDSTRGKP